MTIKTLPEDKFESLKVRGMTSLSFTSLTAVVGRDYKAVNAKNKEESFLVRCSQSSPFVLVQIDKDTGEYPSTNKF